MQYEEVTIVQVSFLWHSIFFQMIKLKLKMKDHFLFLRRELSKSL